MVLLQGVWYIPVVQGACPRHMLLGNDAIVMQLELRTGGRGASLLHLQRKDCRVLSNGAA